MRDGRAGLGHPPWRGGGGVARLQESRGGFWDLNALRLDASANFDNHPYTLNPKPRTFIAFPLWAIRP